MQKKILDGLWKIITETEKVLKKYNEIWWNRTATGRFHKYTLRLQSGRIMMVILTKINKGTQTFYWILKYRTNRTKNIEKKGKKKTNKYKFYALLCSCLLTFYRDDTACVRRILLLDFPSWTFLFEVAGSEPRSRLIDKQTGRISGQVNKSANFFRDFTNLF